MPFTDIKPHNSNNNSLTEMKKSKKFNQENEYSLKPKCFFFNWKILWAPEAMKYFVPTLSPVLAHQGYKNKERG